MWQSSLVSYHFSPKPVVVMKHNIIKQTDVTSLTFLSYTCWAVHFGARPVPGLPFSHAICWIGWSFWTAVLPLAQCGSSIALWMWGGLFWGSQIPLWTQHKRKLLIRLKHPVCRRAVLSLQWWSNHNSLTLWDLVGFNLQSLCWHALFPKPASPQWIM